ncbi:MAG TPA: FHA domain-containing protein [Polyangiaceae bacterium]|nr:FHA domain-containing protein [Polyangiaceae bacterium]
MSRAPSTNPIPERAPVRYPSQPARAPGDAPPGQVAPSFHASLPSDAARADAVAVAPAPPMTAPIAANEARARVCRACGGTNGPAARFCQICGLPLEGASGERPRSAPPVQAGRSREAMPKAELVVIAQDGSPGRRFPLTSGEMVVGSDSRAAIALARDPYVSPEHARVTYRNGSFFIDDCGSTNGVFVRIGGSVPLRDGDLLLVGLGVMRFDVVPEAERTPQPVLKAGVRVFGTPPSPRYGRLTVLTVEDKARDVYYLSRAETVLGRELGDIVFTDDPFMSRRHAALRRDPNTNTFTLRDLGSSNGTFVAIRGSHALSPGDHVRIGQHLFRLDVRRGG